MSAAPGCRRHAKARGLHPARGACQKFSRTRCLTNHFARRFVMPAGLELLSRSVISPPGHALWLQQAPAQRRPSEGRLS